MDIVLAHLINGVALGSIYALLVTGLNLLLLVGGIIQFAYPHLVVMSMYISWMVLKATGNNLALGILAAIGAGVGLSLATEPLFRPLIRKAYMVPSLIVAIGIAIILSDIMSRQIHGGLPIGFSASLSRPEPIAQVGLATLSMGQLASIVGCFSAVAIFLYLLYRTRLGRALRSIGESPWAARLLGIPLARLNFTSYVIAGSLGGISAVFLAMAVGSASSTLGDWLALLVFATVLFAGLGNLKGGLIAGIIIGLVESFAMGYLPGRWAAAIVFGMVMVVVAVRPKGIFGSPLV